jgi:hypothetical protein
MTEVTTGESEIVERGTAVQDPEHVYVAVVVNPSAGNQIITAHRSHEGADAQVDELASAWNVARSSLDATVIELPLLP